MKSVKPGRGPSMMGGIGSVLVGLFGVVWTVMAVRMGAGFMAIFGVIFILIAIIQAVYSFRNATSKNRYSTFDITDGSEEPDPLNERYGAPMQQTESMQDDADAANFCPYCGTPAAKEDYRYCPKCGKALP